jgi:hypothetical protein
MSKESSPSLGDVAAAATFVIAVVAAWLYTVGWMYVYHYFLQFRIPLLLIDLPLQHYFVYGGLVLWKSIWISVAALIAVLAVTWACVQFASRLGRFVLSVIVILVILVLFIVGRAAAIATARAEFLYQYQNDYPAYPRVSLILKKEAAETIGDRLGDIAKTDCGRLVLFSAGRLFLIRPVREVATAKPDSLVLFADQLQALRLLDEYQSCR